LLEGFWRERIVDGKCQDVIADGLLVYSLESWCFIGRERIFVVISKKRLKNNFWAEFEKNSRLRLFIDGNFIPLFGAGAASWLG